MGATVEDVSGKLIISKFSNSQCFGKKSSGLCNYFRASKICLLPALWACDLKKTSCEDCVSNMYTFKHMRSFDMIEPLNKMLPDFKSPARNIP